MRKRKVYLESKRDNNLVMVTALNLLLLTFFVALASFSTLNGQKTKMGLNSLLGGLGVLPGGKSPFQREIGKDITPEFTPLIKGTMDITKLRTAMAKEGVIEGTGISQGKLGITITMRSNILFEEHSDKFKEGLAKNLDVLATILKDVDNRIIITGHMDSRPIEEPPFYSNWGLSSARSLAVLRYLSEKSIPNARMAAYGMGSQRPITSNDNEAGRRLNQRMEITILGNLPGDMQEKAVGLIEPKEPPIRTYQYKGFEFKLEEQ